MQEEDPRLHVVEVHDEVIDLRNELFERAPPLRTKPYGSEPILQQAKSKRRIPAPRDAPRPKVSDLRALLRGSETATADGLKRLAETLYNDPASFSSVTSSTVTAVSRPNVVRNKPILRSKLPSGRFASIDPRFRRARSPSSKNHTLTTQSESRVSPASSQRRKSKSQSDSKFLLNSRTSDQVSTPRAKILEHQGDSARSTKKLLTHKSGCTDTKISNKCANGPPAGIGDDSRRERSADEDPTTITDSTTIVGTSLYQSAVSGDTVAPPEEVDKPVWDDPRLIDKYGKFLKPVSIAPHNSLSSWTLPVQKPSRYRNVGGGECWRCPCDGGPRKRRAARRSCSKCTCTLDDGTTICSEGGSMPPHEPRDNKLCSLIRTNYLLAVFFAVGSLCGLLLVAFVIWVVANDVMWSYAVQRSDEPRLTGAAAWAVYVCGGVIYGIMYLCRAVGYLFVMPRNEVYESGARVDTEPWYTSLISWP